MIYDPTFAEIQLDAAPTVTPLDPAGAELVREATPGFCARYATCREPYTCPVCGRELPPGTPLAVDVYLLDGVAECQVTCADGASCRRALEEE